MSILLSCSFIDLMLSMKIIAIFFLEMYKLILNFIWQCKGPRRVKIVTKKKKKGNDCRTYIAYLKTYFKDTIIK